VVPKFCVTLDVLIEFDFPVILIIISTCICSHYIQFVVYVYKTSDLRIFAMFVIR